MTHSLNQDAKKSFCLTETISFSSISEDFKIPAGLTALGSEGITILALYAAITVNLYRKNPL